MNNNFFKIKRMARRNKKIKKTQASVLITSLIIMSIVLISSLSIALIAARERRVSIGASRTGAVFQSVDQVVEQTMEEIHWGGHTIINEIDEDKLGLAGSISCTDKKITNGEFTIEFFDSDDGVIDCNSSDPSSIENIAKFKVAAASSQASRAVEVKVGCNIRTCQQLMNISSAAGGYYCLAEDIDCKNINFTPITNFSGVFNGNGFKILNIEISSDSNSVGIFSNLINSAEVRDLGIITGSAGVKSTSSGANAGILAGTVSGTSAISKCYSSEGKIEGSGNVGGLIGEISDNSVVIDQCYSDADVTVTSDANGGGLVGSSNGSIKNSYAFGEVEGEANSVVGGLVGYNDSNGSIENSYYGGGGKISDSLEEGGLVGHNNKTSDCTELSFYDSSDNNIFTCGGGTSCSTNASKATNDMEAKATYTTNGADWDFTSTWQIEDGGTYPCFQWQGDTEQCPD